MWISRRAQNRKAGFLLLEVLVSITLISVGLVYSIRSLSASSRAIETAAQFLRSVSLLEDKLWDLEAKGTIKKGTDSGQFARDQKYSWNVDAEEDKDLPINVVTLKVEWIGESRRQRVSLQTCLWNDEE
jgi:type II secretory pathway pseudopilin PulG